MGRLFIGCSMRVVDEELIVPATHQPWSLRGFPAEFFTNLGMDLRRRSPIEHTFLAELSNDWIGYLPDRKAHEVGGYQVWAGFHSCAEPGTGERLVDEVLAMLQELAGATMKP